MENCAFDVDDYLHAGRLASFTVVQAVSHKLLYNFMLWRMDESLAIVGTEAR